MLKNFRLVHTDGMSGVFYKGRTIPFDKIDDKLAEELVGKTHMLERVGEVPAPAPVALALPEATTSDKKKDE